MSVRFQARLIADSASEYLALATRGAPVAQAKHARTTTLIGQALDTAMGATAVALYDVEPARITMGVAYLARGGLAALGAYFTGFRISLTGTGSSGGDSEVSDFERPRRYATAGVNVLVGAALLTGIAGREAAIASTAKGAVEAAVGPLVETLTKPTKADISELVRIVVTPPNARQLRVAESDLKLLGVESLPALCAAYGADVSSRARVKNLIRDIVRWPAKDSEATIAAEVGGQAARLMSGGRPDIEDAVQLLGVLDERVAAAVPREHIEAMQQVEQQLARRATGTAVGSDERKIRDSASSAIARLQGRSYTSLDRLMDSWDTSAQALSSRVEAIGAFGAEAIEPLRQSLARLEEYCAIVSMGAEVSKRLETLPVAEALSVIPDGLGGDMPRGRDLVAMRTSGNVNRQELDHWVRQAPGMLSMRDAYRSLLASIEGRTAPGGDQASSHAST